MARSNALALGIQAIQRKKDRLLFMQRTDFDVDHPAEVDPSFFDNLMKELQEASRYVGVVFRTSGGIRAGSYGE
jgi:hypothetical protein